MWLLVHKNASVVRTLPCSRTPFEKWDLQVCICCFYMRMITRKKIHHWTWAWAGGSAPQYFTRRPTQQATSASLYFEKYLLKEQLCCFYLLLPLSALITLITYCLCSSRDLEGESFCCVSFHIHTYGVSPTKAYICSWQKAIQLVTLPCLLSLVNAVIDTKVIVSLLGTIVIFARRTQGQLHREFSEVGLYPGHQHKKNHPLLGKIMQILQQYNWRKIGKKIKILSQICIHFKLNKAPSVSQMTHGYEQIRSWRLRAMKLSRFTDMFCMAAKPQNN